MGKSDVATGMVSTSDSTPSGMCIVFARLEGDGFDGSLDLPFHFPLSALASFDATGFLVFGFGFGFGFDLGRDGSSSDEESSMTSSYVIGCLPLACDRARDRSFARSAMSIISTSKISTPLSETCWVVRTVVAVCDGVEETSIGGSGGGMA